MSAVRIEGPEAGLNDTDPSGRSKGLVELQALHFATGVVALSIAADHAGGKPDHLLGLVRIA